MNRNRYTQRSFPNCNNRRNRDPSSALSSSDNRPSAAANTDRGASSVSLVRSQSSSRNNYNHNNNRYHRYHTVGSTAEQPLHQATETSMDLDGFYFDATRQRYFRIMPAHAGYDQYTRQQLSFQKIEQQRLQMMDGVQDGQSGLKSKTPSKERKRRTSPLGVVTPIHKVCLAQQLGNTSGRHLTRFVDERRLIKAPKQPSTSCKVLEDMPDVNLESCQYLDVTSDGKMALGCWSVRQSPWGTRIMCLRVDADPKKADELHFGLNVKPTGNFIYTVDRRVVDICQAKMDSSVTCILYVTMPTTQPGSRIFLQPLPEISDICDQEFLESPIYNAHWATSESAWACAWEPRHMRVSLGLERCGIIRDVVAEKDFKLYSRQKNPITQRFSKDGNLLFMGLRGNEILCCDLRLTQHHTIFTLPQLSTCWISIMSDANQLLAANYSGEVNLWDLRQNRVVQTFTGLKNSYTKTPIVVSEDETCAFGVGEDGTTRAWSLKSGATLCSIAAPYPVTGRDTMPRLCYSNRWAHRYGNAAIALGVRDELHFYELTL